MIIVASIFTRLPIKNLNLIPCKANSGINKNKKLVKITDILGREVEEKRNTPLFYIYNDGTVEKKIIIE